MMTKMARLAVAQSPCSAVLPTVHGCHYAFRMFPFFLCVHPVHKLDVPSVSPNIALSFLLKYIAGYLGLCHPHEYGSHVPS